MGLAQGAASSNDQTITDKNLDLVRFYVSQGADINAHVSLLTREPFSDEQSTALVQTVRTVCDSAQIKAVSVLLELGADPEIAWTRSYIKGGADSWKAIDLVWFYTRSAGVWTQQGPKFTGTGSMGSSVTISADGNTVAAGSYGDNGNTGAVWIYVRSAGVWSQQGLKLVGTGAVGTAMQGYSVALSADGNTLLSGGATDNAGAGSTWVFTRSAGVWTQEGAKLVGTGGVAANQGSGVALSADGNLALIGGYVDNGSIGAGWVFTRSGGVWSQQGLKFVPSDVSGTARFGSSVALSANGETAVLGGWGDNGANGAGWSYVP